MADQETSQVQKTETPMPEGLERTRAGKVFSPAVDIRETNDSILVIADMPGVGPDDVDITLESDQLTLRGCLTVQPPADKSLAYSEYEVGDYQRSFSINEEIDRDKVEARIVNGVLTVTLPKAQPTRRKIEVKAE